MVRPLINPRRSRIPAESLVREDWQNGITRREMAALYGVSTTAIDAYLKRRMPAWTKQRVRPLEPSERKIVVTREAWIDSASRRVRISLPRISMHVAALEGRQ